MPTHTIGQTYSTDAGQITSTTDQFNSNTDVNITEVVPATTTNMQFDIVITVANIKSMVLYSDQAMTLKTNSTSSPANTITLAARKQVVWNTDHAEAKPFTANVTAIYATNATATDATLKVRVLLDQTP